MLKHKEAFSYKENFDAIADVLRLNGILSLNRGAEIGVRKGAFSEHLLLQFPKLEMRLVDPYEPYQDLDIFYTEEMQAAVMKQAFERFWQFVPRACWYFEPSTTAARHVPDGALDFVFVDAEHTYDSVRADLKAWAPKVRKGGLLCGHDYSLGPVGSAVDTFVIKRGLRVEAIALPADVWMVEMV